MADRRILSRWPIALGAPPLLAHFLRPTVGSIYGARAGVKLQLVRRMVRNNLRIVSASNFLEHLYMAERILAVPRDTPGVLVECGTYKGGSAANLSLVAALTGRRMHLFDSFRGLPAPAEHDRAHVLVDRKEIATYEVGSWSGSAEEVRSNLARFGRLDLCELHPGFFEDTLPGFREPCVFVYIDADLRDSVASCIKYLWPQLQPGGVLFTHEAPHPEIASLFFDRDWWRRELDEEAPGLVGAGTGIGLVPERGSFGSGIGYAVKAPDASTFRVSPQTG